MAECRLCPRLCGVDRAERRGYCGAGSLPEVSKIMLHHWEEPPISGDPADEAHGSGAIFFAHCSLGCVYCQNRKISRRASVGRIMTPHELADAMLELEKSGAYNVNLVTPTHVADVLVEAVREAKTRGLSVPVVWNTGGYERAEVVGQLADTVDVFLTDFKYVSPALSGKLSSAPDYAKAALPALRAMVSLAGPCVFDGRGMMRRGVIVRHLVLPGCAADSIAVLRAVAGAVPVEDIRLSLMAQYTPDFLPPPAPDESDPFGKIRRRVTTYEYDKVAKEAAALGFEGWMQERSSATKRFTPDF